MLFRRSLASAVLLGLALAASLHAAPPNVIVIITDDQGYGDVGAHGNTMIQTPHLDRLHGESVRLTDFHVDPTCSPTRSALMTGRYSTRTGVWHTIMGRSMLRPEEVTIAELFRRSGYRTGMFGKWHLGDNYPSRPQDVGFEVTFAHGGGGVGQTPDAWGNDYFDDTYFRNGRPEKVEGYCTDVWFNEAIRFITASDERPFFAYLSTNAPHGPFLVDERYSKPYRDRGVPNTMARFYGMITNIDENIGRLVAKLDETKIAADTVIVFMTDNGTAAGVGGRRGEEGSWKGFSAGMRGKKGSEYDGGHRVPFFVRWPGGGIGGTGRGRDLDVLTAHIDVLPTLAGLCGVTVPKDLRIDGTSLAAMLRGEQGTLDRTLFVHSQRIEHPKKWRKSAVMTKRWRLVNGTELFDLAADPAQATNVADAHAKVVARLRSAYDAWWESLTPRFAEFVPIVLGSPKESPSRLTCHDWHGPNPPWNQGMVRRAPMTNGFWAVDVEREGLYEFVLRTLPASEAKPLTARSARLAIGETEVTATVPAGASAVTLRARAAAGPQKLQTWLTDPNGKSRGAYFVEVRPIAGGDTD